MQVQINDSWQNYLQSEFEKPYFQNLVQFVKDEYSKYTCFPKGNQIFAAFAACSFEDVKVVIIGQDPYHGVGQANGLCFSVNDGIPFPPSLQNIFKEIEQDLGKPIPPTGNLERWAKQGVLLLNATLTVRQSEAGSHQKKVGKPLPMRLSRQFQIRMRKLFFYFGVVLPKRKELKLIETNILFWKAAIRRH